MFVMAKGVVLLGILLNTCLGAEVLNPANDYQVPIKPHQTNCVDKITDCKSYGKLACIGTYEPWARDNCAATCGYCRTSGTTIAPAKICVDKMNDCDTYDHSACFGQYEPWARDNCAATCGYCSSATTTIAPPHLTTTVAPPHLICVDKLNDCNTYGSSGCVGQYEPWARDNCAATCGYCKSPATLTVAPPHVTTTVAPPHSHCVDKLNDCNTYDKNACVGQYEKWARDNCAATCGFCNSLTTTPVQSGCDYKNHVYREGEHWVDGCDYNCTCEDGNTGYYRCRDLCITYTNVPHNCQLVKKTGECCAKPVCQEHGNGGGCYYKGHDHAQNETWIDGCDYHCKCIDASRGFYQCTTLCLQWTLPKSCTLHPAKAGKCCPHPSCPDGYVINYPPGYVDA